MMMKCEADEMKSPESVVNLLNVDAIEFEFGYGSFPCRCEPRRGST